MVVVVLATTTAAILLGCGSGSDDPREDPAAPSGVEVPAPETGEGAQPGEKGTGPSAEDLPDRRDILPGRLAFVDVTGDEIRDAVAAYDGEIEVDPEGLRIVQVRFPVDVHAELIAIRDELRDQGHRVDVVLATDPGIDGDDQGFLDVEP